MKFINTRTKKEKRKKVIFLLYKLEINKNKIVCAHCRVRSWNVLWTRPPPNLLGQTIVRAYSACIIFK